MRQGRLSNKIAPEAEKLCRYVMADSFAIWRPVLQEDQVQIFSLLINVDQIVAVFEIESTKPFASSGFIKEF